MHLAPILQVRERVYVVMGQVGARAKKKLMPHLKVAQASLCEIVFIVSWLITMLFIRLSWRHGGVLVTILQMRSGLQQPPL